MRKTRSLRCVNDYARNVLSGKTLACKWIHLACERHLTDLDKSAERDYPYCFDRNRALRAIEFIELLPHVKGQWAQRHEILRLQPWQCFAIGSLFGWVKKADGLRRFREAYWELPRKNGKSVTAAAIGLYCLLEDNEFGAEVYSGATTEKQSWEVFRPARLMAMKTGGLCDHYGLEINAKSLARVEDYSRFEPIIGNPGDGASPSCAIVDEFHEHDKPDLYDTMSTGMGAREQPLLLVITTAGTNLAGPCYEKRVEAQKVLDGALEDERLFSLIYTMDDGDDWRNTKVWSKANPNLGVSVSREYLQAQIASAVRNPGKINTIKTKHFNVWCGAKSAFVSMEKWTDAGDSSLALADFADCEAIIGLDLAVRVDLAAAVILFRKIVDGKVHYYSFPTFYLPEEALTGSKNAQSYAKWAAEGHIVLHDGDEIDFNIVQEDTIGLFKEYNVLECAFDIWQAAQMGQNFREAGMETLQIKTTYQDMSGPMREFEGALAAGRFHHPDNPVFTWMASNLVAKETGADNRIRPIKELPESKIDGMVAMLMALSRWCVREEQISVYESRGLRTL